MNTLRNRVTLIGRLGQDPEMKTFEGGSSLVNLNIATNEYFKNSDGKGEERAVWHKVVAWGKTAEIAEKYLKKGSEIAIEGRLSNRTYEDKDGNTKYITEVVANELVMLGKKD